MYTLICADLELDEMTSYTPRRVMSYVTSTLNINQIFIDANVLRQYEIEYDADIGFVVEIIWIHKIFHYHDLFI